jgi:hypothetical protein
MTNLSSDIMLQNMEEGKPWVTVYHLLTVADSNVKGLLLQLSNRLAQGSAAERKTAMRISVAMGKDGDGWAL